MTEVGHNKPLATFPGAGRGRERLVLLDTLTAGKMLAID
jgi:hypothetical protein